MRACQRPMEGACCRDQKFVPNAYTARFRVIHTRKTLCALRVYTQTVIGVFFVDRNSNTQLRMRVLQDDAICFASMDAIFKPS